MYALSYAAGSRFGCFTCLLALWGDFASPGASCEAPGAGVEPVAAAPSAVSEKLNLREIVSAQPKGGEREERGRGEVGTEGKSR